MAEKILVVDDDPEIRALVEAILKKGGYSVRTAESAEEALEEIRMTLYDLLILDLNLPGISGIKMCEILKQDPSTARLPVIMLTSQSAERTKVQGLQTGADDYIVKPPAAGELTARVQALIRRVKFSGVVEKIFQMTDLKLDLDRHEVTIKGTQVALRPKEFQLLSLFMEKRGRVLSRSFLFEALWEKEVVSEHTLEVHVNHLREKLGPVARYLQTIPGTGYKFEEPV